jgi:hypothetical protein
MLLEDKIRVLVGAGQSVDEVITRPGPVAGINVSNHLNPANRPFAAHPRRRASSFSAVRSLVINSRGTL